MNLLLLLISAGLTFGLDSINIPVSHVDSAIIEAESLNVINNSIAVWSGKFIDSVDIKFIRFTDLSGGDSTLDTIKVNYIRSKPDVDSIQGYPWVDSILTNYIRSGGAVDFTAVDTIKSTGYLRAAVADITSGDTISATFGNYTTLTAGTLNATGLTYDTVNAVSVRCSTNSTAACMTVKQTGGLNWSNERLNGTGLYIKGLTYSKIQLQNAEDGINSFYMGDSSDQNEYEIRGDHGTGYFAIFVKDFSCFQINSADCTAAVPRSLTAATGFIATTGDVSASLGDVVAYSEYYYGDKTTDGSWRSFVRNDSLIFERKITGTWTYKGGFSP